MIVGTTFDKPPVEVGQIVLWRYGPLDKAAIPAIVCKVGNETLTVGLFTDSNKTLILKSGVRHRNDPFLNAMPQHDLGCWDLTPRDERLNAMLADYESDVALSASLRADCEDTE